MYKIRAPGRVRPQPCRLQERLHAAGALRREAYKQASNADAGLSGLQIESPFLTAECDFGTSSRDSFAACSRRGDQPSRGRAAQHPVRVHGRLSRVGSGAVRHFHASTPNIDRLFRRGTYLPNSFAVTPVFLENDHVPSPRHFSTKDGRLVIESNRCTVSFGIHHLCNLSSFELL